LKLCNENIELSVANIKVKRFTISKNGMFFNIFCRKKVK